MPFAFALFGSLLIHAGLLFGPEWEIGSLPGADRPPMIDAVITSPSISVAPAPVPVASKSRQVRPVEPKKPSPPPSVENAGSNVGNGAVAAVPPAPTFAPESVEDALPIADNAVPVAASEPDPQPVVESAPPVPAIALPARGHMEYHLSRGESGFVIGKTVHDWEHDGHHYRARSVTETTGIAAVFKPARVVQVSEGEVDRQGLRPGSFRHEKVKGVDSARFDWARRLLSYEDKEVALPDGTQDMLSFYYQATLAALPESELVLPIATGRKLESYRFTPQGAELVEINGRGWQTRRYAAKSGNDLIEIWITPEHSALPLKIRFIDNKGDIYDQIAVVIETKESQ